MAPPKKVKDIPASITTSTMGLDEVKSETKKTSSVNNTTVKVNNSDSDRLQLAQAINNIVVRGESFVGALEQLSNFSKERLVELDLKIESKKQEYEDLMSKLENHYKDTEIKLKQNLQENKLQAVKEVLSTMDMICISNVQFNDVQHELQTLKSNYQTQLDKAIETEKEKATNHLNTTLKTLDLSHRAEIATLKAQTEQQIKEISVLNETIKNLKHEINEQRLLTKEVAIASSKSQIQQSFGAGK